MSEYKDESLRYSSEDEVTDTQKSGLLKSHPGSDYDTNSQGTRHRSSQLTIGFLPFSNIILAVLLGVEYKRGISEPQPLWKPPGTSMKQVFQPSAVSSGETGPESEKAWADILPSTL